MDLLDELGPQLRALTADQPVQPGDRVPDVIRRARGIRRTRIAIAAAAALAVATPAALVISSTGHHEATQYADITTWPDRSARAEKAVAQGAVESYSAAHSAATVQWLYRDAVDMPNGKQAHLAIFIATTGTDRMLVTAMRRNDLAQAGDLPPSWEVHTQDLKAAALPGQVGLYLSYNRPAGTEGGVGNLAFLLTRPGAHRIAWREKPLPGAPVVPEAARNGSASSEDGVFVVDVGTTTGPVEVAVDGSATEIAWSDTSAPELVHPTVQAPEAWTGTVGGGAYQTERQEGGAWTGTLYATFTAQDGVLMSCYGGGTLTARVELSTADTVLTSTRVTCDGSTVVVRDASAQRDTRGVGLSILTDRLQAIAFVTGHPSR